MLCSNAWVDGVTDQAKSDGRNEYEPEAGRADWIAVAGFKLVSAVGVELHMGRTRWVYVRSGVEIGAQGKPIHD